MPAAAAPIQLPAALDRDGDRREEGQDAMAWNSRWAIDASDQNWKACP
jgi:hypothetical protein